MSSLLKRYENKVAGTLSCFDRMLFTGTIPGICYAEGMAAYLRSKDIKIFDYPRFAEPLRDELCNNAERIAMENGIEIEFIRSVKAFRKEDRIKEIIQAKGVQQGLVHIFAAMEPCTAYKPWHDKSSGKTSLKTTDGKCKHYYFYFVDDEYGLCYLRVPTWAPFRLQFYCNGHNHLAKQMDISGIGYRQLDNTFISIDDWAKAQSMSHVVHPATLHRMMDRWALMLCPVNKHFYNDYHWSIMQCELSFDIAFKNVDELKPIYDNLSRTAIHAVKCDNVATFLGRKLDGRYKDELGNDFHTRVEGTRIKHHMGPASIKMYDKQGIVLRIETTINDVTFFRHYRTVEHRDGSSEKKTATMQKTIYSLPALSGCMSAANRRYLEFISELDDPTASLKDIDKVTCAIKKDGRNYAGFNFFDHNDMEIMIALLRGEGTISGITNKMLRKKLSGKTTIQVSRILKRMRMHGLIKKAQKSFKYYLTSLGRRALVAGLKLREFAVIPMLNITNADMFSIACIPATT